MSCSVQVPPPIGNVPLRDGRLPRLASIRRPVEDELLIDGVDTVEGYVDSWAERSAARENAFDGGAVWVEKELVVDAS
jgi:hypothetical protein